MRKILLSLFLLILPVLLEAHGKRALVWVLDAGHGGKDMGCEGTKCQEKDIALSITLEVARLLRVNKPGIRVILTRDKDEFLTLDERCQKANRANADLFLSIHVNYAPNKPLLQGTETFYASTRKGDDAVLQAARVKNADKSELLAWLLQKSYYDAGRVADRGAKTEHLYVVMHTMMPAALTEVGFMSNIEEQAYLKTDRGQKEIAACIYNALNEYYTTTQAKTHTKTLATLRRTNGTSSGLKTTKIAASKSGGPYFPTVPSASSDDNIPPPLIPETFEEGELEALGLGTQATLVEEPKVVLRPLDSSADNIPPPLIPETFDESPLVVPAEEPEGSAQTVVPLAPVVEPVEMDIAPVSQGQVPVVPAAELEVASSTGEDSLVSTVLEENGPEVFAAIKPEVEKTEEPAAPAKPMAKKKEEPVALEPKEDKRETPVAPESKVEKKEEPALPEPRTEKKEVQAPASSANESSKGTTILDEKPKKEEVPVETKSKPMPVFSIQIVSVSSELKSSDPRLKGLSPITFVKSGSTYKGLYGGTTDYKQAKVTLESIRTKFPDAFIVAYLGAQPIATAEAIEMTKRK